MPRPGPRKYECVRRSWHSDRHQPIRGSIIQQIFRVVHENHSIGTKKNREWQEKLPLVVMKSEEIMYSKANSEAEYVDQETLWDRVNDAIDTIIRRDESLTGELLPPCVEAALNLGCVIVKTSRSQRNNNTRTYLNRRNQDPIATNTRNPNFPNRERPNAVNHTHTFSETNRDSRQNYPIPPRGPSFYPPSLNNTPKKPVSIESKSSLAPPSVYPLYYGLHFQPQNPRSRFQTTHQNSNPIIVGTPVFQTVHEPLPPPLTGFSETPLLFNRDDNGSKKTVHEEPEPSLVECDLSLRLGNSGSSWGRPQSKEFSFFPLNSEGEQVRNLVADFGKRKAVNNDVADGGQRLLQLELDFNQKRRGV